MEPMHPRFTNHQPSMHKGNGSVVLLGMIIHVNVTRIEPAIDFCLALKNHKKTQKLNFLIYYLANLKIRFSEITNLQMSVISGMCSD